MRVRMNLTLALAIALVLHLLLLLGVEMLPGLRAAWLLELPERPVRREPLHFTFVALPQEAPEPEKPPEDARPSDRARIAVSAPAPEDTPASRDPYAVGNTQQRMDSQAKTESAARRVPKQRVAALPVPKQRPFVSPSIGPQEMFPAPPGDEGDEAREEAMEEPEEEAADPLEGLAELLRPFSTRDLGQRFDNPQAASATEFGAISFDTVGIDWGPYARRIVEIIRARWIERFPPAAQMGLKGRSVVSFRIRVDGAVFAVELKDSSGVRPLDKAAEFAIEAAQLPPLPEEFMDLDEEDVGVTFEFYYNMRVPRQ